MAESTESSTSVAADPARVLGVIADLEAYPDWVDGVQEVQVLAADAGRPVRARFVVNSGPIKDTYVLDYTWDVAADGTGAVSWSLVEASVITRLDGSYRLAPEGAGTTVTYRLSVDVRIPMLGMLKRKAERVIIDAALTGLRTRVEN